MLWTGLTEGVRCMVLPSRLTMQPGMHDLSSDDVHGALGSF